ncbi:MAG: hypothetical protein WA994_11575, partial [Ornithinimicrobium sp.]
HVHRPRPGPARFIDSVDGERHTQPEGAAYFPGRVGLQPIERVGNATEVRSPRRPTAGIGIPLPDQRGIGRAAAAQGRSQRAP